MKIPRVSEGEDPAAIVSFEMEQMILPRLSGPHVPQCFARRRFRRAALSGDGALAGKTLYARLNDLPLPYEEASRDRSARCRRACDLHRQNVVHLDIKPSNIMFRASGEAVLIDYGLSHHKQLPDLMQEEFRVPYGTAPYMAPERLSGMRNDPRSDIFSLGVLLYFFTTGERPFGESETMRCDAPAVVARSVSAAPVTGRLSAVAAGDRAALPRDRAGLALSDGGATGLRSRSSRSGQAHRARGKAAERDPLTTVWRRRFNRPDLLAKPKSDVAAQLASSPIVAVAIDLSEDAEPLQ